jgi:hypothetical protein
MPFYPQGGPQPFRTILRDEYGKTSQGRKMRFKTTAELPVQLGGICSNYKLNFADREA